MIRKTIEFGTLGTRLSVSHHQLVVERPDLPTQTLPIEDLGVVIIDDVRASYTQSVFLELLEAGATVLVSGRDHLPVGMMLPLDAHHVQTERHRAQIEASEPARKQAWKAIVASKIRQQGLVLREFNGDTAGLDEMAKRVRSGDPDNLEAQAAQRYWPKLFGTRFRRDRFEGGINSLLNYGYAVIRASGARAIVAAGLIPSLGVFHKNRSNPFCLADDMIEPYRPLIDWKVRRLVSDPEEPVPSLEGREIRGALLSVLNETILVGERRVPVLLAMHASATSISRAFLENVPNLALPESLPLKLDAQEENGDTD